MYSKRTKFLEYLLSNKAIPDNVRTLLQNGFIPESYKDDYDNFESNESESDLDKLVFSNYFNLNPEKVSGVMVEGSGYINPVKVKGDIDDVIKAFNTMGKKTVDQIINPNEPNLEDLLSTFFRMGEDAYKANKKDNPLDDSEFMEWYQVQDSEYKTASSLRQFKKEWREGWLSGKILNDTEKLRSEPQKNDWIDRDKEIAEIGNTKEQLKLINRYQKHNPKTGYMEFVEGTPYYVLDLYERTIVNPSKDSNLGKILQMTD